MTKNELLAEVLSLPRQERLELLRALQQSLGDDALQPAWHADWGTELTERVGVMWGGEAGVPREDVLSAVEEKARKGSSCAHGGRHH